MNDKNSESGFQFNNYSVEDINFKINYNYKKTTDLTYKADFNFKFSYDGNKAFITIGCKIFEDYIEENYPFFLHIKVNGEFLIIGDISKEEFKSFCEVNGTAALFPYVRSVIANITMVAGIKPLQLPLFNIYKLIEKKKMEQNVETNKAF